MDMDFRVNQIKISIAKYPIIENRVAAIAGHRSLLNNYITLNTRRFLHKTLLSPSKISYLHFNHNMYWIPKHGKLI